MKWFWVASLLVLATGWTQVALGGGLWFDDGTGALVRPDREEVSSG